nr:MAG TPA: DNA N-6-adenine-methyltransferase [Caudoviricetes sp.]
MEKQTALESNAEYEAFVDKFKPKLTTDDCYTPPEVYEVVKNWACAKYGIDPAKIVRPFYPGGDYESFDYSGGAVVVDNPPFSILSKICAFYLDRGIPFFLFAPLLTAFSGRSVVTRMNHIICDAQIVYENGAVVNTAFVTSYGGDIVAQTAPELGRAVQEAVYRLKAEKTRTLPKYDYPDNVVTAAMLQRYSKYGIDFKVRRDECTAIAKLDAQAEAKKAIFGGGLLLSERKAAEKAAAKKAAAEKAAAEKAVAEKWKLSKRELKLIEELGRKAKR